MNMKKLKLKEEQKIIMFGSRIQLPLEMRFEPKEDITPYELALCLPYILTDTRFLPISIDASLPHFRHFKIIDHNEK